MRVTSAPALIAAGKFRGKATFTTTDATRPSRAQAQPADQSVQADARATGVDRARCVTFGAVTIPPRPQQQGLRIAPGPAASMIATRTTIRGTPIRDQPSMMGRRQSGSTQSSGPTVFPLR